MRYLCYISSQVDKCLALYLFRSYREAKIARTKEDRVIDQITSGSYCSNELELQTESSWSLNLTVVSWDSS